MQSPGNDFGSDTLPELAYVEFYKKHGTERLIQDFQRTDSDGAFSRVYDLEDRLKENPNDNQARMELEALLFLLMQQWLVFWISRKLYVLFEDPTDSMLKALER